MMGLAAAHSHDAGDERGGEVGGWGAVLNLFSLIWRSVLVLT